MKTLLKKIKGVSKLLTGTVHTQTLQIQYRLIASSSLTVPCYCTSQFDITLKVPVELCVLMAMFPVAKGTETPCSLFTNGEPGLGRGPLQEVPRATGAQLKTQVLPLIYAVVMPAEIGRVTAPTPPFEPFMNPKLIPMRLTYWGAVTCVTFDQGKSSGAAQVTA